MVKVKGQLLSLGASGTIGKAATFSNWKGRAYAKKFASPTNNQQAAQLGVRACMTFLSQQWVNVSAADKATWEELAAASSISPFDAYVGENLTRCVDGKGPTMAWPAAETAFAPTQDGGGTTAYDRYIILYFYVIPPPTTWGTKIFRADATGFTPGVHNLVGLIPTSALPDYTTFRDTPPSRGTWYYKRHACSEDGSTYTTGVENSVVY